MTVNKLYSIVAVMPSSVASLEGLLNDEAARGYEPVFFWDAGTKLIAVLKFTPPRGRPKKTEEDTEEE